MNWNQEELEQWALTQQQKEDDNTALERYTQQDDGKIKELSIAIERMSREVLTKRNDLEREVTDTQVCFPWIINSWTDASILDCFHCSKNRLNHQTNYHECKLPVLFCWRTTLICCARCNHYGI